MTGEPEATAYTGWAIVELMGHRRLAGHVSEVSQFGTAMIRVDVPTESDGQQPVTQFYGGGAIYCLTPVSEESARAVARYHRPQPVHQYELTPPTQPLEASYLCDRCEDVRVSVRGGLCVDCTYEVASDRYQPSDDDPEEPQP